MTRWTDGSVGEAASFLCKISCCGCVCVCVCGCWDRLGRAGAKVGLARLLKAVEVENAGEKGTKLERVEASLP